MFDPGDSPTTYVVERLFDSGWKHLEKKRPRIKRILAVSLPNHLNESYEAYKYVKNALSEGDGVRGLTLGGMNCRTRLEAKNDYHGANEQLVFHGTSRQCSLGEYEECISLCGSTDCSLCSILRTSFLVSKAGTAVRVLTFKR